ncbi:HAMP domain-containing sensor histidine kinase [Xanthobacter autotrophicus DSM 597]|uniref:sensor histidine kinase n=1 Tax=Xanthobacter wiegelii TaxID=3119913 RepID=UPI00372B41C8
MTFRRVVDSTDTPSAKGSRRMSGPLCLPLGPAAASQPEPAEAGEGFAAPAVIPAKLMVIAIAAVAGVALAGGAVAGPALALLGAAVGAIGVFLVGRHVRRLDAARAAAEARASEAEAESRRVAAESLAKSRFLAEMSHELRTPLNTVMGFSEMMAEEVLGPHRVPAYGGYARDIHGAGRHLLALADDLLDLARIESGHRTLVETPVRLDALAEDCLAMMRPLAAERRLRLSLEQGATVRLWGDERAIRQVALNLLTNAVKFTPLEGQVRLVTGLGPDGGAMLVIEDSGPGIADGELPLGAAHARESRLDLATGRGAGLGLAIARGLATLHGGELELARRAGGGTRARVTFPPARTLRGA